MSQQGRFDEIMARLGERMPLVSIVSKQNMTTLEDFAEIHRRWTQDRYETCLTEMRSYPKITHRIRHSR